MFDTLLRVVRHRAPVDKSLNWGRDIVRDVADALILDDNAVIVDIGAGLGYDLSIFQERHPRCTYHAIDYREDHRAHFDQKSIVFHAANIETDSLPLASSSVDVIIINQVLEHCKQLFWILHEVSRVLRVGGHMLVGVPNLASLHNRILLCLGHQPTCITVGSAHIRGFTRAGLESFMHSCAPSLYAATMIAGSNFYPFPPKIASTLSSWFPNCSVSIFVMFRKNNEYGEQFLLATNALESNFWDGH